MSNTTFDMFGLVDERDGNIEIIDTSDEVAGYLYNGEFVCIGCVENEFSGNMEAFWIDEPIPVTAQEALEAGYLCSTCD